MKMNDRFDELLPWYVNGTLSADDRAWVDTHVAAHPQARAELNWMMALQTSVRSTASDIPDTIGLAKTMKRIRAGRPTLGERLGSFLGLLTYPLGMRPAAAFAALAIVVVQGGMIVHLLDSTHEDETDLRALRATTTDQQPMLKLNFKPDAKESDIRLLLVSVQGQLAGGPGQLGDYYVIVPPGKVEAAVEQLKSQPIVQAVSLAPGLPPRE
jgi:hypothetical protein